MSLLFWYNYFSFENSSNYFISFELWSPVIRIQCIWNTVFIRSSLFPLSTYYYLIQYALVQCIWTEFPITYRTKNEGSCFGVKFWNLPRFWTMITDWSLRLTVFQDPETKLCLIYAALCSLQVPTFNAFMRTNSILNFFCIYFLERANLCLLNYS